MPLSLFVPPATSILSLPLPPLIHPYRISASFKPFASSTFPIFNFPIPPQGPPEMVLQFSLEPLLRRFFHCYGRFVHRYRWAMFLVPPLISLCLSVGFLWFSELEVDDPAYVFTPREARWKRELNTFSRLWPLEENKFLPGKSFETKRFVNVLCKARDGGNILRPAILDEIALLNQFIAQNITVPTVDGRFNLSYQDLCLSYNWVCGSNEHIEMFRQMAQVGRVIDLSYPKGGNKDTPAYLGTAIGDIKLNKTDDTVLEAKITQLFFFLKQDPASVRQYSTDFEYAVERFLLRGFESPLLSVSFAHYQSLQDGLDENARRFVPNFVISLFALTLFCLFCSFTVLPTSSPLRQQKRRLLLPIDWIRSKPFVACAGLINTILALTSSFGFLLLLGVPYNVINTIIPFLIIAVGIDDMFVMNACWDQSDQSMPPGDRMAHMMQNGGVAVSITNITDVLAFLIGCITELPGIELFCLYAFSAVLFCYIYQLTFFAGCMAIMGNVEAEGRHCLLLTRSRSLRSETIKKNAGRQTVSAMGQEGFVQNIRVGDGGTLEPPKRKIASGVPDDASSSPIGSRGFFGAYFGPFLLHPLSRAVVALAYGLFLLLAIVGCMNFREGLEPSHLVTSDHYIARYFEDMKIFWKMGAQLHVAVLNPPNFTDPLERQKLLNTVAAFENTPYTMGREGTVFFFLEFLNYLDQLNAEPENTDRLWNQKLRSWLKYTGGSNQWESDIVFSEHSGAIRAFRFQVAMKDIVEPDQHKLAAKLLREIADRQPFRLEIYHEAFPFADQYLIILPSTIRNVLISLMCMTVIAFLLIPSIPSAILIILSIVSIATGVFGYMTFWGVNLDAVSMISIIMSIGFAVDLSAHIVYAFVIARGEQPKERVINALEHIGWPIFQGAASTIVGISVLYTVDAYIILTFFKTIWLTMVMGLVHGLVFIPVLLSFLPMAFFQIQRQRSQRQCPQATTAKESKKSPKG